MVKFSSAAKFMRYKHCYKDNKTSYEIKELPRDKSGASSRNTVRAGNKKRDWRITLRLLKGEDGMLWKIR